MMGKRCNSKNKKYIELAAFIQSDPEIPNQLRTLYSSHLPQFKAKPIFLTFSAPGAERHLEPRLTNHITNANLSLRINQ